MNMDKPIENGMRKFWEWCGFRKAGGGWTDIVYKYPVEIDLPDPTSIFDGKYAQLPPIDLNNLSRYAIPKLIKEYTNWESVLHKWVDGLTGDYEKDTFSLYWLIAQTMV